MTNSKMRKSTRSGNYVSPIFGTVLPVLSEFSTNKSLSENYLLKSEDEFQNKMTKTKILCTIGPKSNSREMLRELLKKGMSIARFNLSHSSIQSHTAAIKQLRKLEIEMKQFCAIMIDTRGYAIRMTQIDKPIKLKKGALVTLKACNKNCCENEKNCIKNEKNCAENCAEKSDEKTLFLNREKLSDLIAVGEKIVIGYGLIELKAAKVSDTAVECEIMTDGVLNSHKTVFFPKGRARHPSILSEEDKKDIEFAVEIKADFVAASYVNCAEQIREIKKILKDKKAEHIEVVSKLECEKALLNFEEILSESDGIMVSRGNLGEETDIEAVTLMQKLIIRKCNSAGKPVITATQLLESMVINPFPTRAEASDVGNAVFDGTDCLMLSGETASGLYPIEATEMLSAICRESERSVNHQETFQMIHNRAISESNNFPVIEAVASSAVKMSFDVNAAIIIAYSYSGRTGRLLSKYRPMCPVLLMTDNENVARKSLSSRGLISIVVNTLKEDDSNISRAIECGKKLGLCKQGDLAIVVHGSELPGAPNEADSELANMVNVVSIVV